MNSVEEPSRKLRLLLEESVKRNLGDGILLSGGLDTSIIASIASKYTSLRGVTVAFSEAEAPDVKYAELVASLFGIDNVVEGFSFEEMLEAVPEVVRVLHTFDPMEIRNSVVIYVGLKALKKRGVKSVMTGDGADELFAGYSYLFHHEAERLGDELRKIWSVMSFSSIGLASSIGVEVKLPYLNEEFKEYAMEIKPELKVGVRNGVTYGKWILRKAFEDKLPAEVVWRVKQPIEVGSGTTVMQKLFEACMTWSRFEEEKAKTLGEDRVVLRDKEQLFYYKAYRSIFGAPQPSDLEQRSCPYCRSNVAERATFCRTCGAYPV